MASLPTDRTTANTPAEHVADHNTLHALHNLIDGDGNDGDVLTRAAGAPAWAAQSGTAVLKDFAQSRRTGGDLAVDSTAWVNVDTALDLVLTAATGDLIEVGVAALWGSEAINGVLDVASVVSAVPVNYWGSNAAESATSRGVVSWWGGSGTFVGVGGSIQRTLVAGDISAGTVTLRLRRRGLASGTKTLFAQTDIPLVFWAKNLGPTPA